MKRFAAKIKEKLSRRTLFRIGLGILALYGGRLFLEALESLEKTPGRIRKIKATLPTAPGAYFIKGAVIIVRPEGRTGGGIRVLSTRCTHLGCELRRLNAGTLVCPCHGSQFSIDGEVRRGPALRELRELKYRIDPKKNTITVDLES